MSSVTSAAAAGSGSVGSAFGALYEAAQPVSIFGRLTTALSAISTVVGTIGEITKSQANTQADTFNAQVATNNEQIATDQGKLQLQQQQVDAFRKLGAIKAAYGASGVTTSGSPLDVLADSYTQSELDANTIIYNAKVKAAGYQNTAALETAKARNDTNAGYMNAASTALLGVKDTIKAYDTVGTS